MDSNDDLARAINKNISRNAIHHSYHDLTHGSPGTDGKGRQDSSAVGYSEHLSVKARKQKSFVRDSARYKIVLRNSNENSLFIPQRHFREGSMPQADKFANRLSHLADDESQQNKRLRTFEWDPQDYGLGSRTAYLDITRNLEQSSDAIMEPTKISHEAGHQSSPRTERRTPLGSGVYSTEIVENISSASHSVGTAMRDARQTRISTTPCQDIGAIVGRAHQVGHGQSTSWNFGRDINHVYQIQDIEERFQPRAPQTLCGDHASRSVSTQVSCSRQLQRVEMQGELIGEFAGSRHETTLLEEANRRVETNIEFANRTHQEFIKQHRVEQGNVHLSGEMQKYWPYVAPKVNTCHVELNEDLSRLDSLQLGPEEYTLIRNPYQSFHPSRHKGPVDINHRYALGKPAPSQKRSEGFYRDLVSTEDNHRRFQYSNDRESHAHVMPCGYARGESVSKTASLQPISVYDERSPPAMEVPFIGRRLEEIIAQYARSSPAPDVTPHQPGTNSISSSEASPEVKRGIKRYFVPDNIIPLPKIRGHIAVPYDGDRDMPYFKQWMPNTKSKRKTKTKASAWSSPTLDFDDYFVSDRYYEQFYVPEDQGELQQSAAIHSRRQSSISGNQISVKSGSSMIASQPQPAVQIPAIIDRYEMSGEGERCQKNEAMGNTGVSNITEEGISRINPTYSLPMKDRFAPLATPPRAYLKVLELRGQQEGRRQRREAESVRDKDDYTRGTLAFNSKSTDDDDLICDSDKMRDDSKIPDDNNSRGIAIPRDNNNDCRRVASDARKKAQREAEGKKREAAEQARLAERRERAHQRIERNRREEAAKRQEEYKELGRKRQEATTVQSNAVALVKLKANIDEARRRAAGLSAGKLSRLSINPESTENYDTDVEDSLFIPEDRPATPYNRPSGQPPGGEYMLLEDVTNHQHGHEFSIAGVASDETVYDIDQQTLIRKKGPVPSNAIELFARTPSKWVGRDGYRAERAEFDAQREAERLRLRVMKLNRAKMLEHQEPKKCELSELEGAVERQVSNKNSQRKPRRSSVSKVRRSRKTLEVETDIEGAVDSTIARHEVDSGAWGDAYQEMDENLALQCDLLVTAVDGDMQNIDDSNNKTTQRGRVITSSPLTSSAPQKAVSRRRTSKARGPVHFTTLPDGLLGSLSISDPSQPPTSTNSLAQSKVALQQRFSMSSLPPFREESSSFAGQFEDPRHVHKRVKLISDSERQALDEAEQMRKQEEKEQAKRQRAEQLKLERQNRGEQAARDKQQKKLIEEAEETGGQVTQEELNDKLEAFMEKRKRDITRRRENRERAQKVADFAPDSLMLESGGIPQLKHMRSQPNGNEMIGHPEHSRRVGHFQPGSPRWNRHVKSLPNTPSDYHLSRNVNSAADLRGYPCSSNNADDSSDESVESPDDENPALQHTSTSRQAAGISDGLALGSGEKYGREFGADNDAGSEMELDDVSAGTASPIKKHRPGAMIDLNKISEGSSNMVDPGGWVRFYEVCQQDVKKNIPREAETRGTQTVSRRGANKYAAALFENYRTRLGKTITFKRGVTEDGLFKATITESNGSYYNFFVRSFSKVSSALDKVPKVNAIFLTNSIYIVHQTIKTIIVNPETSSTTVNSVSEPVPGKNFTDRDIANYRASEYLAELLRPKTSKIDDVLLFQSAEKQISDVYAAMDGDQLFYVEVDKHDGGPPYMEVDVVIVEVRLFQLTGPWN